MPTKAPVKKPAESAKAPAKGGPASPHDEPVTAGLPEVQAADAADVEQVPPSLLDDRVVRTVRDRMDEDAVERYRDAYLEAAESVGGAGRPGDALPAVRAFSFPGPDRVTRHVLGDGGHRRAAAVEARLAALPCLVTACRNEADAVRQAFAFAAAANTTHGVPRSVADRKATVRAAVLRPEFFPPAFDREIARACRVSKHLVRVTRQEMDAAGELPAAARREYKSEPGEAVATPADAGTGRATTSAPDQQVTTSSADVQDLKGDAKVEMQVDAFGVPVPGHLKDVFAARSWFRSMCVRIGALNKEFVDAAGSPHGSALVATLNGLKVDFKNATLSAAGASPHAVCPACGGGDKPGVKCPHCLGRGWLTRALYGHLPHAMKHSEDADD